MTFACSSIKASGQGTAVMQRAEKWPHSAAIEANGKISIGINRPLRAQTRVQQTEKGEPRGEHPLRRCPTVPTVHLERNLLAPWQSYLVPALQLLLVLSVAPYSGPGPKPNSAALLSAEIHSLMCACSDLGQAEKGGSYQVKRICLLSLPLSALLGSNAVLLPSLDFPHVVRRVLKHREPGNDMGIASLPLPQRHRGGDAGAAQNSPEPTFLSAEITPASPLLHRTCAPV